MVLRGLDKYNEIFNLEINLLVYKFIDNNVIIFYGFF